MNIAPTLRVSLVALSFALPLAACASKEGPDGPGNGPTFHADVEPILQKSCLSCHRDGQIGGFSLLTYDEAAPLASMIAAVTASGQMPPFKARDTDDCQVLREFAHDPRLAEDEIAVLRGWADAGAPEGDPAQAPPPYEAPSPGLAEADFTLTPDEPQHIEGDHDDFVCVIYDPAFDEPTWLDGMHLLADNTAVAHHAITSLMTREEALEASGGAGSFPCFGGAPGTMIHAWAPGGPPFDMPADVGMRVQPDEVFVVQMHYHPTGTSMEHDASSLQLRLSTSEPAWQFMPILLGNARDEQAGLLPGPADEGEPRFLIPANAEDHSETMRFPVSGAPGELPLLLVASHMHYIGQDMRLWIERPEERPAQPGHECLLETPEWDFNWQGFYQYDVPISELPTVANGDVLTLRCEYNNSLSNRFLQGALDEQGLTAPIDAELGEDTLDEMCIGLFGMLVPVQ